MASTVTIEGSITPSAVLARGERRTVRLTERVQRLIDRGFVVVVGEAAELTPSEVHADTEANADSSSDPEVAPAGNASREVWARFLESKGVTFPDGQVDEDGHEDDVAGRDELIAIWQASGVG